jgi:hypothetical protein
MMMIAGLIGRTTGRDLHHHASLMNASLKEAKSMRQDEIDPSMTWPPGSAFGVGPWSLGHPVGAAGFFCFPQSFAMDKERAEVGSQ